jgi:Mg-chelatase subunit ChlD
MLRFENPFMLTAVIPLALLATYTHFRLHSRIFPRLLRLANPMTKVVGLQSRKNKRVATLMLKLAVISLVCLAAASPYIEVEKVVAQETEAEFREALQVAGPAVVIVLDVSGSMADTIPGGVKIDAAKSAVKRFLDNLPDNVSVGLIAFDDKIRAVVPISSKKARLVEVLEKLEPGGGTMYTYPLRVALSMLKPYRAFNASSTVVFISDGLPADNGLYDGLLSEMRKLNVSVHTVYIGPGGDAGAAEMKRVASLTGGLSFNVEDADSLINVFEGLARTIARVAVNYKAKVVVTEKVKEKISLGWLFLTLAAAALTSLLYARYRVLGLTV